MITLTANLSALASLRSILLHRDAAFYTGSRKDVGAPRGPHKALLVVIEVVASAPEIANYEGVFAQLGIVTTIAKATVGVVPDEDRRTDAQTETGVFPEAPLQSGNCG
jgi:hypothetical protein